MLEGPTPDPVLLHGLGGLPEFRDVLEREPPDGVVPGTVTRVPGGPLAGENDEIVGGSATRKRDVLDPEPAGVVIAIVPVAAFAGTVAVIQSSVASGQTVAACGQLTGFVNEVSAQSSNKIPATHAGGLVADAQRIRSVLGCSK